MNLFILLITALISEGPLTLPHGPDVSVSSGKVKVYADYALFPVVDSLQKLEVYYMVDLFSLGEKRKGGKSEARYRVNVELTSPDQSKKPMKDQWVKVAPKAELSQFTLDAFNLLMLPGHYDLKLTVSDLNSDRVGIIDKAFVIPKRDTSLTLSDIQLATRINQDTTFSAFKKYGFNVVPNPLARYSSKQDTLFFLTVVDNLTPKDIYTFTYGIYDSLGNLIKAAKPQVRQTEGKRSLETGGLIIADLTPGVYKFVAEAVDITKNQRARKEKPFIYASQMITQLNPEAENIIGFIDYIASQEEIKTYKSLSKEGKKIFLEKFWRKRDPNPKTPENEFLREYIKRVIYADKEFSSLSKKGRFTDRGRIYIKYGPPDEVKKKSLRWGERDQERWSYYFSGGIDFIFVDVQGNGDYRLMWTNAKDEPVDPNWRKYVDPNKIHLEEEEW